MASGRSRDYALFGGRSLIFRECLQIHEIRENKDPRNGISLFADIPMQYVLQSTEYIRHCLL